jgi:hypothetical protein
MTAVAIPRTWLPPRRKVLRVGVWRPTEAIEELFPHFDGDIRKYAGDLILWMAGSKTNFFENAVKNEVLGAAAFAAPANIHVGLWTGAGTLTDAATGSTGSESAYTSYARVNKVNNTTNFASVGDNVSKKNSTAITFPTSTGGTSTVTQVGMTDAASAGNMYLWGDLTASRTIDIGEIPEFAINAFTYDED